MEAMKGRHNLGYSCCLVDELAVADYADDRCAVDRVYAGDKLRKIIHLFASQNVEDLHIDRLGPLQVVLQLIEEFQLRRRECGDADDEKPPRRGKRLAGFPEFQLALRDFFRKLILGLFLRIRRRLSLLIFQ